jgi:hypothetical protein
MLFQWAVLPYHAWAAYFILCGNSLCSVFIIVFCYQYDGRFFSMVGEASNIKYGDKCIA